MTFGVGRPVVDGVGKAGSIDVKLKKKAELWEKRKVEGLKEREDVLNYYGIPDPEPAAQVDERDVNTPDEWVHRRPELLRLTGLHPFNVEPPLPILMSRGFLTPASLHYVRNHGPVPKLSWETHRIELTSLDGKRTVEISMNDLATKFPLRTMPVTLTCAGNRRKEQNVVKKSIGFSWGCGAVSTSIWTGVRLSDVLEYYGMLDDMEKTRYICFEGTDDLPKGKYGTSVAIETVMDPGRDVLLAFEQNGERLTPDHGFPVRMLIPGFIGGRMVKWLKKVWVSDKESDNHYHFMDNRVLPAHVTEDIANKEGWWFKPEFIINDRNINSAISSPAHNEVMELATVGDTYFVKGYAYNGGGRPITRVEVSLDYGKTWELTNVSCWEKPNAQGKYWCWIHWSIAIDPRRLLETKEICCRAYDESINTQPGNLTWNVMGMMNNPWFRVKIYPIRTESGALALKFKHPATIEDAAGWMVDELPQDTKPAAPVQTQAEKDKEKALPKFTRQDVAAHNTKDDCWIIVADKVYDVTKWIAAHPGGETSIIGNAGKDSTSVFDVIHSQKARDLLAKYLVGLLKDEPAKL